MSISRTIFGKIGCRFQLRPLSSQPPSRTQSEVGDGLKQEGHSSEVEGHKPIYATRDIYQKKVQQQRYQSADAENGQRPTRWQRRFLVWTKLYQSQSEIPEIVAHGTMNRMHDRMRVIFIVTACLGFFSFFFAVESWNSRRIQRDRDAGVVVTKM